MRRALKKFLNDQAGATAIEYGLIGAVLSLSIIPALASVNSKLSAIYGTIGNLFNIF